MAGPRMTYVRSPIVNSQLFVQVACIANFFEPHLVGPSQCACTVLYTA